MTKIDVVAVLQEKDYELSEIFRFGSLPLTLVAWQRWGYDYTILDFEATGKDWLGQHLGPEPFRIWNKENPSADSLKGLRDRLRTHGFATELLPVEGIWKPRPPGKWHALAVSLTNPSSNPLMGPKDEDRFQCYMSAKSLLHLGHGIMGEWDEDKELVGAMTVAWGLARLIRRGMCVINEAAIVLGQSQFNGYRLGSSLSHVISNLTHTVSVQLRDAGIVPATED